MLDGYLGVALPPELWLKIIFYLSNHDLYRLRFLNSSFWRAAWRRKFRHLRLTPTGLPPNRWYEKWPSWTRMFMFRGIFHRYSQPDVNQALTSLTLSANIETLIWKWRREFQWLRSPLIKLCLPSTPSCVAVHCRLHRVPQVFNPLSCWSCNFFPAQIVSFAQSLTHVTSLELCFLSEPKEGCGTWRYKVPWEHPRSLYFCEVLKCLAPKLLRLYLRNWPRSEEDLAEVVQFPELKVFVWTPHSKGTPLSCLRTIRESLRGSDNLEELGVAFFPPEGTITEAGILPIYVEELLYPYLRKFGTIWLATATLIPPDVRQFLYLYRDSIQITFFNNSFQRWPRPTSEQDVLSLLNLPKLRALRVNMVPTHRYEQLRSALMASTTLRTLNLVLNGIPSSDNAFAFLPNLRSLKLEFQDNFWWDEPLWMLMKTLPSSLPALKKLEIRNGWALMEALPGNIVLVSQGQRRRTAPQELLDDLSYSQQPYTRFTDSLRAVLKTPRWQSWGLKEIEVKFRSDRAEEDQRFVHTLMAKYLPKVLIFGGVHRSTLQ